MPFTIEPPPLPNNTDKGIGIFIHKSYDYRHIKVFQDVALSIISKNPRARYVIHSFNSRCLVWVNEYLSMYGVPPDHISIIDLSGTEDVNRVYKIEPPMDKPEEKRKDDPKKVFNGKNTVTLQEYKTLLGQYELDSVYIFTDNKKSIEITELIKSSELLKFKVYTITSDGDYENHSNINDPMNHKAYYGGIYRNEHLGKI